MNQGIWKNLEEPHRQVVGFKAATIDFKDSQYLLFVV